MDVARKSKNFHVLYVTMKKLELYLQDTNIGIVTCFIPCCNFVLNLHVIKIKIINSSSKIAMHKIMKLLLLKKKIKNH